MASNDKVSSFILPSWHLNPYFVRFEGQLKEEGCEFDSFKTTSQDMKGWSHPFTTHLVADVYFNPGLDVIKDLFDVPCPGSSQVTGITVRLQRTGQKVGRGRGGEKKRWRCEFIILLQ